VIKLDAAAKPRPTALSRSNLNKRDRSHEDAGSGSGLGAEVVFSVRLLGRRKARAVRHPERDCVGPSSRGKRWEEG